MRASMLLLIALLALSACGRVEPGTGDAAQEATAVSTAAEITSSPDRTAPPSEGAPLAVTPVPVAAQPVALNGVSWTLPQPEGVQPLAAANAAGVLWVRFPQLVTTEGTARSGMPPIATDDYALLWTPWRAEGGALEVDAREVGRLPSLHTDGVQTITALAPAGERLFWAMTYALPESAQNGGRVRVLQLDPERNELRELLQLRGEGGGHFTRSAFNERWLFWNSSDVDVPRGQALLLDLVSGEQRPVDLGGANWTSAAAWQADGRLLVTRADDGSQAVVDPTTATATPAGEAPGAEVATSSPPLEQTLWQLDALSLPDGRTVTPDDWDAPTALFAEGSVTGRAVCNRYETPYRIAAPDTLTVDPVLRTAAGCEGAQGELEELFVAALWQAQRYKLAGDTLTISGTAGELRFRAQSPTTGSVAAVYTAVLREWDDRRRPIVVLETPLFSASGAQLEPVLTSVERELAAQGGVDLPALEASTLDDFRAQNQASDTHSADLELGVPIIWLGEPEWAQLFAAGEAAGWADFRQQYADAERVVVLSQVGFNAVGTQALVITELRSEGETSRFAHILQLYRGLWQTSRGFRLP